MSFDARQFRNCLSHFATGVTVVTCLGQDGKPHGVTVNSFSSVSLDPPLILFNLDLLTGSLPSFQAASGYSINMLTNDQTALSQRFAETGIEKWEDVVWHEGGTGAPNLAGTLACLDCSGHAQYPGGDHLIFVGQVEDCHYRNEGDPLLFYNSVYRGLDQKN